MLGSRTGRATIVAMAIASAGGAAMPALADDGIGGALLRGGGSSFAAPLFKGWIETYRKVQPELSIEYNSVGSGEGISRFVTGSLDFAGTDAPLPPEQAALAEGKCCSFRWRPA